MLDEIKAKAEAQGYRGFFRNEKLNLYFYNGRLNIEGNPSSSLAGSAWMEGDQLMMSLGHRIPYPDKRKVSSPDEVLQIIMDKYPPRPIED